MRQKEFAESIYIGLDLPTGKDVYWSRLRKRDQHLVDRQQIFTHDMSTPIHAVSGFVTMIGKSLIGTDTEKAYELGRLAMQVKRQGAQLLHTESAVTAHLLTHEVKIRQDRENLRAMLYAWDGAFIQPSDPRIEALAVMNRSEIFDWCVSDLDRTLEETDHIIAQLPPPENTDMDFARHEVRSKRAKLAYLLTLMDEKAYDLRPTAVDIGKELRWSWGNFNPDKRRYSKGLERIEEDLTGTVVEVDVGALFSVVDNLERNASRHGGKDILVEAGFTWENGQDHLQFRITNDGEPISAEDLPHIFDLYWKGQYSKGSGVGLYIAKQAADALGGTLAVESGYVDTARTVGRTVFTLTVPVKIINERIQELPLLSHAV